jgi:hypothetical protein
MHKLRDGAESLSFEEALEKHNGEKKTTGISIINMLNEECITTK